jgi:ATP-dependent DNA helicase RecQ
MILDYFGDDTEAAQCGCDVCRRDRPQGEMAAGAAAAMPPLPESVTLLVRQLLSGIARLRGKFGVSMVADVLIGADNVKTRRWGFEQLSVYGLLKAHSQKRVVAMLHRLMEAGLAKQKDPEGMKFRPVMELTAAGVAVMKGEQLAPAGLADLVPRRIPHDSGSNSRVQQAITLTRSDGRTVELEELPPEAERRFQRLRSARMQIARERKLPPYVICHDRTLKLIAVQAPADAAGLERIKGIGPNKVRLYGQAFLDALHHYEGASAERVIEPDPY